MALKNEKSLSHSRVVDRECCIFFINWVDIGIELMCSDGFIKALFINNHERHSPSVIHQSLSCLNIVVTERRGCIVLGIQ